MKIKAQVSKTYGMQRSREKRKFMAPCNHVIFFFLKSKITNSQPIKYIKELEEEQTKLEAGTRKKIIKIRTQINKIVSRKK